MEDGRARRGESIDPDVRETVENATGERASSEQRENLTLIVVYQVRPIGF